MPDGDDSGEEEYGGFVFENGESADHGDEAGLLDGTDTRRIAAAVLLSLAIIVFAVFVLQPFVTGAATNLFGGDSSPGSGSGNATSTTTAGETSSLADTAGETTRDRRTTDATATTGQGQPTSVTTTATPTVESTAPGTPTRTANRTTANATASANTTTATATGRSPVIESFTVTDRSAGGNASFAVAWNVTDPDVDLASIQVTIVADPDGEATTVAQRRFDAGGQSTVGDGTFEIPEGSGGVYEVRLEVVDAADNSVFALRREVADGEPDE
ncbi:hypothetical protein [Halococcus agarilyticus]|uniref:hypothetical protein n=1 Tax=Halococcus agarilyticus TaxID=1232219 RepID=UPI00067788F1|nr:hypothetical protein [Halococcus agarilyticus]